MFKLNRVAVACAASLGALTVPEAHAVLPGNCANAAAVEIYLSGASAPQNILGNIMTDLLDAGFTTVYSAPVGSVSAGTDYRAYCGTAKAAIGAIPAGTTVRFVNRAKGGSLWGVNPVARRSSIATLSFADADCVAAASGSVQQFNCKEAGDDLDASNASNRIPDFGVSDVEPAMFKTNVNLADVPAPVASALSSTEVNSLAVSRGFQVIFGLAATENVPQSVQFTRGAVANILSGGVGSWSTIGVTLAPPSGLPSGFTAQAIQNRILVCRREPGSGTQAVSNDYFLRNPCVDGNTANPFAIQPARQPRVSAANASPPLPSGITGGKGTETEPYLIGTAGITPLVIEASTSGEVRNCLAAAQDNTVFKFLAPTGIWYQVDFRNSNSSTYNVWGGIGVLSGESHNNGGVGTATGRRASFRPLNGVPSSAITNGADTGFQAVQAAAQVAAYDFVYENTFQYVTGSISGNTLDFVNAFIDRAQRNSTLINLSARNEAAVLAIPNLAGNGQSTGAIVPNTSILSRWTKNANSCSPFRVR